jgi:organic radical activating enzyme
VRFFGCNNNCDFCDSKYSTKIDDAKDQNIIIQKMSYRELNETILDYEVKNVVFTGGEPLLQMDFIEKFYGENSSLIDIEIETNGTIALPLRVDHNPIFEGVCFNISPKLTNSGNSITEGYLANLVTNVGMGMAQGLDIHLKFVVDTDNMIRDLDEIEKFLDDVKKFRRDNGDRYFNEMNRVYLMPMGIFSETVKAGINALSVNSRNITFPFIISPRLQVLVYGNKIGV